MSSYEPEIEPEQENPQEWLYDLATKYGKEISSRTAIVLYEERVDSLTSLLACREDEIQGLEEISPGQRDLLCLLMRYELEDLGSGGGGQHYYYGSSENTTPSKSSTTNENSSYNTSPSSGMNSRNNSTLDNIYNQNLYPTGMPSHMIPKTRHVNPNIILDGEEENNNNIHNNNNNNQQQVQQQHVPRPIPYVGLLNPSCICYLNSLIQCLYHTPAFRSAVFKVNTDDDDLDDTPKALQNLFYSLGNANEGEAQSAKLLTESFGWGSAELSIQHDIQELFVKLRESVENRLEGSVDILFSGLGENYIRCLDDSYTSAKSEYFHDLILPVQNHPNLDHSLDDYCAVDRLDGTNKYKVERPGMPAEFKDAEKGYRFLRFAPVVFVHLKRFEMDFNSPNLDMKKINTCFEFPKTLDLSRRENQIIVTQEHVDAAKNDPNLKKAFEIGIQQQELFPEVYGADAADPEAIYELYAVLVHSGGVQYGHYTCNIRDIDDENGGDDNQNDNDDGSTGRRAPACRLSDRWYNYDDAVVSEISEGNAVDRNYGGYTNVRGHSMLSGKNAYMLAYVRKPLIPRLFRNDDRGGLKTLSTKVQEEFSAKIREQKRLYELALAKNRQCHITFITDRTIAETIKSSRQTELLENGDSVPKEFSLNLSLPKDTPIKQLYSEVSKLLGKPVSQFRLHWFLPIGKYDTKFRISGMIDDCSEDDDEDEEDVQKQKIIDTIANTVPDMLRVPDRPWNFKLYIEFKVVQPAHVLSNCARYAKFRVTSNEAGLAPVVGDNTTPAIPFCDNRMFPFDEQDLQPRVEVNLDKKYNIEAIAFQCPLPKRHTSPYGCTRYDVRMTIFDGDKQVFSHIAHHQSHTQHSPFHSDNIFADGPYRGNRVLLERINVNVYDHYMPRGSTIPVEQADPWIISRLKVQCIPGETGREASSLYTKPRFITDDMRAHHLPVKFYSYRTCHIDFFGHVSIPIAEFMDVNYPVLRDICGLDPNAKIRVYAETDGVAEPIEAHRKHFSPRNDTILIVQEEPPTNTAFIYEMPFVTAYLRSLAGTRTVMLFSFKAPEDGSQAIVRVPDYATHDMVCEEVGKALNVPWDRIRLYGCRDVYGTGANAMPVPQPEAFRSDEVGDITRMISRQQGVLFYDVLKCSLKEAESVMEVICHLSDELGNRVSGKEPFHQEVSVSVSLLDLAEMMLEHFGYTFETCHAFIDLQENMIENFAIVVPAVAEKRGAMPSPVAGSESTNATRIQNKTSIVQFFRSFQNREFELRPYPEADSQSQVYVTCHGEFYQNGYPQVIMHYAKTPAFVPMPLTADVSDAKQIVMEKFDLKDEDLWADEEQRELILYIHTGLHFPDWTLKMKDYFFHNVTQFSRPKALLINYKRDFKNKNKHMEKNAASGKSGGGGGGGPVLSLTKNKNKDKEKSSHNVDDI